MRTSGTVLGVLQAHRHSGGLQPHRSPPTVLAILASRLLETSPCDSLPVLAESFSLQPLPPVMVCGLPEAMSWSVSPTSEFCIQATQGLAGGGNGVCMCCWLSGGGQGVYGGRHLESPFPSS